MFCYSKLLAAQAMPKLTAGRDKQKSRLSRHCKPLPNAVVSGTKPEHHLTPQSKDKQ